MKFIFLLFLVLIANIDAKIILKKLPPAKMVMMGGFDDDVESVDNGKDDVIGRRVLPKKHEEKSINIYVGGDKKDSKQKDIIENEESISYGEYENQEKDLQDYPSVNPFSKGSVKIALLTPSKVIHGYSQSVSNAVLAYLLYKKMNFKYEVFDTKDESEFSINKAISELKAKGYQFVIAPFTKDGARIVMQNSSNLLVFIPTINKNELPMSSSNVIFGGVDYIKQLDMLLSYANDKIAIFNDGSQRSAQLSSYIKEQAMDKVVLEKEIKNIRMNLRYLLKNNRKKLTESSIFLNMPIVKSSLLASQIRQYGIKPYLLLSTQANYNPLIFKLTQKDDRKFFYVANVISDFEPHLLDINLLLGNSPKFNWLEYSTLVGIDYILYTQLGVGKKIFSEDVISNQIEYDTSIKKATGSSFEPVSRY